MQHVFYSRQGQSSETSCAVVKNESGPLKGCKQNFDRKMIEQILLSKPKELGVRGPGDSKCVCSDYIFGLKTDPMAFYPIFCATSTLRKRVQEIEKGILFEIELFCVFCSAIEDGSCSFVAVESFQFRSDMEPYALRGYRRCNNNEK